MEPTSELLEQLDREEVERARRMSFDQKFLAGAELFDYACSISISGIHRQHPEFNEDQVMRALNRRVHIMEEA